MFQRLVIFVFVSIFSRTYGQFQLSFGTPTPLGPKTFDPNCKDVLTNCWDFPESSCQAPYQQWAKDNCPNRCGICIGPTTAAPPCVNAISNCESYDQSICTNSDYKNWASANCRQFCRFCTADQLAHIVSTTISPANCKDKVDCRLYGPNACNGKFKAWAEDNCPNHCGFCQGLPTAPPVCVDKIPNCNRYAADTCTNAMYKLWSEDNCKKFCGLCSGAPTISPNIPPSPPPPGKKRSADQKRQFSASHHHHNHKCWDTGSGNYNSDDPECLTVSPPVLSTVNLSPGSATTADFPGSDIRPNHKSPDDWDSKPSTEAPTSTSKSKTTKTPDGKTDSSQFPGTPPTVTMMTATKITPSPTGGQQSPVTSGSGPSTGSVNNTAETTTTAAPTDSSTDTVSTTQKGEIKTGPPPNSTSGQSSATVSISTTSATVTTPIPSQTSSTKSTSATPTASTTSFDITTTPLPTQTLSAKSTSAPLIASTISTATNTTFTSTLTSPTKSTTASTPPPPSWKIARACWGSDPHCNKYKLECPPNQKIILGTAMYGTKTQLQACQYGISNCAVASACCFYNASDKLTPFAYADLTILSQNCLGKSFCEVNAPRLGVPPFSSYVLMNYTCSESTTQRPSVSKSSNAVPPTLSPKITTEATTITITTTTTTPTTPTTTAEPCKDTIPNCKSYGKTNCNLPLYRPWYQSHCASFCNFCDDYTKCNNKLPNCAEFDDGNLCTADSYYGWASENCYLYCGFTPCDKIATSVKSTMKTTTEKTTITTTPFNCTDKLSNCVYYDDANCVGIYEAWARQHCPQRCGYCNDPLPCIDNNPDCDKYPANICTQPDFRGWARDNCRKFCNLCSKPTLSPVSSATGPSKTPTIGPSGTPPTPAAPVKSAEPSFVTVSSSTSTT